MADDLTQIRDYFVEQAKDLGIRIQEKSPATGYRYTADLFDGDKRIGRLYMRKTTVSWKAAGARSVVRLSGSEDVAKLLGKSGVRSETKKQQEDKETDAAGDKERTQEIPKAAEPGAKKTTKSMKIEESAEKPGTDAKKVVFKAKKAVESEDKEKRVEKDEPEDLAKAGKDELKEEKAVAGIKGKFDEKTEAPDEKEASKSVETEKEAKPVSSLSRAVSEFKSGNFEKAIQWARLSLAENPESAAAKDILHRAERLLTEKKQDADGVLKREVDRPDAVGAVPEERAKIDTRSTGGEKDRPAPKEPDYSQKTAISAKKTEIPVSAPPKQAKTPPEPSIQTTKDKKIQRGARIPLWVVVAFVGLVTAVVYLWPGNKDGVDHQRDHDAMTALPESTVDPIETLQAYIEVLEENVKNDTTGTSTAKLMNALIEMATVGSADTAVLGRIQELAFRADSLAAIASRDNELNIARSFLDEGRDGWRALLRFSGDDSVFTERLKWNQEYRTVNAVRDELLHSMIHIPEGAFTRGSNRGAFDSRPASEVPLSAFYISVHEITNKQYRAFLFDTGRSEPTAQNRYQTPYGWTDMQFPEGKGNYPVVLVKWEDANAFAEWFGGSLPSEAQWEKAARGSDGRHYPWGNGFYADSLVCRESRGEYSSVGSKSGDVSPLGVHDMGGNVREWVKDWYGSDYYLSRSSRQKDPNGPRSGRFRVVRGASWRTEGVVNGLTHARENASPWTIGRDLGFRIVMTDSTYASLQISKDTFE